MPEPRRPVRGARPGRPPGIGIGCGPGATQAATGTARRTRRARRGPARGDLRDVRRAHRCRAALAAARGRLPFDRDALSARVLGDPAELAALEALVHPAVHHERTRFIVQNADAAALLFDIPLLFETGGDAAFDKVIVVSATPEIQRERVLSRPGMSREKFEQILARQLPDEEKRARADFVVDTSLSLEETRAQVGAILACLGLQAGV